MKAKTNATNNTRSTPSQLSPPFLLCLFYLLSCFFFSARTTTFLPLAAADRDALHPRRAQQRGPLSPAWQAHQQQELLSPDHADSSKRSWQIIVSSSEAEAASELHHQQLEEASSSGSFELGHQQQQQQQLEDASSEFSPKSSDLHPLEVALLNSTSSSRWDGLPGSDRASKSNLNPKSVQTANSESDSSPNLESLMAASDSYKSSEYKSNTWSTGTRTLELKGDDSSSRSTKSRPMGISELQLEAQTQLETEVNSDLQGEAKFKNLQNSKLKAGSELSRSATASASATSTQMMGLGLGKEFLKILAMCAIFAIAFKMISSWCKTKQADVRRCKPIGRFLMWCGWDEFETFEVLVTVHSVGDIQKDGMMGSKEFKIVVNFNWSKFETVPTKDCKWEQTKSLVVPQGATECSVSLFSLGTIKDSKVGGFTIETKDGMLDAKKFWNEKKKYKIEYKGKQVGTLSMTFRKRGDGEDSMPELPIEGIDEESGLAIEVLKEWEDLCNTPGYVKPESGKLQGEDAIYLLSKVLTDDLREIDPKGKELGKVYIRVVNCNYADLQGDDRNEALQKQMEKARKKGLSELERKWYWCWYEDKKAAESKWTHPDGFIPMACITAVCRTPGRSDEFVIKHSQGDPLRYRRESGKGLDTWVDGVEIVFNVCRNAVKDKKDQEGKEEAAMQRMAMMHQQWVQSKGAPPQTKEEWKEWKDYFTKNNYDEELINKFYYQMVAAQKKAAGGGGGGRRGR